MAAVAAEKSLAEVAAESLTAAAAAAAMKAVVAAEASGADDSSLAEARKTAEEALAAAQLAMAAATYGGAAATATADGGTALGKDGVIEGKDGAIKVNTLESVKAFVEEHKDERFVQVTISGLPYIRYGYALQVLDSFNIVAKSQWSVKNKSKIRWLNKGVRPATRRSERDNSRSARPPWQQQEEALSARHPSHGNNVGRDFKDRALLLGEHMRAFAKQIDYSAPALLQLRQDVRDFINQEVVFPVD